MAIRYGRMGKHGVLVSNICLGTMKFGWHTSEKDSFAIMDRALELGINFFDTADVYGWAIETGLTEKVIGRWLALGEGRRESIILATKVYDHMERRDARPEPSRDGENLSAVKIKRHWEGSLRRLQTDCIDLYQMHHIDRSCPWDEIWQAFHALIEQGKVIPACRHYGMGLILWSPLAGGLLAGALEKFTSGSRGSEDFSKRVGKNRQKLEAYESLCRNLGEPPAVVGLAWLLHNPSVTAPIIGPRNVKQLEEAMRATELKLDAETLKKLDEIWLGPGGEAPEAYAW